MKVLVACEYSGTVRDAFAKIGHLAVSCDLLPSDSPGYHKQCDVREILHLGWDLMIAHPPCTYLSVSGMHWTTRGLRDPKLTEDALDFVRLLMSAPIPKIALENPVSVISSRIRKPDQVVQPWWFGDDASKKTCLWLKGLPKLSAAKIVPPAGWKRVKFDQETEETWCEECQADFADCECYRPAQDGIQYKEIDGMLFGRPEGESNKTIWGNQTPSGQNKLGPSPDRWKIRSKTFAGIAKAMAEQYSLFICDNSEYMLKYGYANK